MSGRALQLVAIALAWLPGCSDCGGCLYHEPERPVLAAADGGHASDAADAGAPDADADRAAPATPPPGPPPLVVAQQYVVGWASGRRDALLATSDGEAADMVRRVQAGETVDTPFGPIGPDAAPATSFSFSDRRAEVDAEYHRITFTVTARRSNAEPTTSRHTVVVRRSDNKVVRWFAPSPLSEGGV
jgi:hypothetical protein